MNASAISSASTAELVAFFNAHSPSPVKRFSDRKTAERRCADLIESAAAVHGFSAHKQTNCPSCGAHLSNGVGEHGDEVNGKVSRHEHSQFVCLGCGEEFGPSIRRAPVSAERSAGIAASWCDKAIRAKRCERTSVRVRSGNKIVGDYKSTAAAFRALSLPMSGHIKFRMTLKASGSATFGALLFSAQ
jgi:hypothetical protein